MSDSDDGGGLGCVVLIFLIVLFAGIVALHEKIDEANKQLEQIQMRQILENQ